VVKVCSLTPHFQVPFGEQVHRLAPTVATFHSTGHPALG
jgi:hypothetical protein